MAISIEEARERTARAREAFEQNAQTFGRRAQRLWSNTKQRAAAAMHSDLASECGKAAAIAAVVGVVYTAAFAGTAKLMGVKL